MKCPLCKLKLGRVDYEGVRIHTCPKCGGSCLEKARLKLIQTKRVKSYEDFRTELEHAAPDNQLKIRCPNCLSVLEKQKHSVGDHEFHSDRCMNCKFLWLDAGELAKFQIAYEVSEKGQEERRFRERMVNMTPEERKRYEEQIANLPKYIGDDGRGRYGFWSEAFDFFYFS